MPDIPQTGPALSGLVLNVMRYSVHDGPGIRTTVFLKGCPLDCWWCHNPESRSFQPAVLYSEERCRRCGDCAAVCTGGAIAAGGGPFLDASRCRCCGACAEACLAGAREVAGRYMTVAEVVAEIERDLICFDESGGGATVSGGEPLSQPDLAEAVLAACRERGIHTVLDTCGLAGRPTMLRVAAQADLVLFDLKLVDAERHARYTGASNERILGNLEALVSAGAAIAIRVPLIPGVNDDPGEIAAMGAFLRRLGVRRLDLLPYHRFGVRKYRRLGVPYRLDGLPEPDAAQVEDAARRFRGEGLFVKIGG